MFVARSIGCSVPLVAETLSQEDVLASDQFIGAAPAFVREKVTFVAPKGIVSGVELVKPVPGVICKESIGAARKLIRLLPLGAPQPVQRSNPVVAAKFVGLAVLKLLPVVMS